MCDSQTPSYWPDGTVKSSNTAFSIPPKGITTMPTLVPLKRGPKQQPRGVALPGSSPLDSAGRRISLEPKRNGLTITPRRDPQFTTRIQRASI